VLPGHLVIFTFGVGDGGTGEGVGEIVEGDAAAGDHLGAAPGDGGQVGVLLGGAVGQPVSRVAVEGSVGLDAAVPEFVALGGGVKADGVGLIVDSGERLI